MIKSKRWTVILIKCLKKVWKFFGYSRIYFLLFNALLNKRVFFKKFFFFSYFRFLLAQCVLNMHDIITWDRFQRKWLNHSDNCYSLVAAETTESPQFVIWAKQLDPSKPLLVNCFVDNITYRYR